MIFFSSGFRPMFLGAALWAALSMILWIGVLVGWTTPTPQIDLIDWHVHELLFGYGAAVLCGFLLTAIPNWTNRAPIAGVPLMLLFALWIAGRLVFFADMAPLLRAAIVVAFPVMFTALALREVLAAGNKRNLPVIAICGLFTLSNGLFQYDLITAEIGADGIGSRIGMSILILLICLIGGRIIPAFTRNWLKARGHTQLPSEFGRFDALTLGLSAAALILLIALPNHVLSQVISALAALANTIRLCRWRGMATRTEPLLFTLHIAYAFIPLGFLLHLLVWMDTLPIAAPVHAWTAGAIGIMTLTVMTRAALGHSGRALTSGAMEWLFLGAIILSALTRVLAAVDNMPDYLLQLSGVLWITAFALFALRFTPVMLSPKRAP